jgi:hypothetical protein
LQRECRRERGNKNNVWKIKDRRTKGGKGDCGFEAHLRPLLRANPVGGLHDFSLSRGSQLVFRIRRECVLPQLLASTRDPHGDPKRIRVSPSPSHPHRHARSARCVLRALHRDPSRDCPPSVCSGVCSPRSPGDATFFHAGIVLSSPGRASSPSLLAHGTGGIDPRIRHRILLYACTCVYVRMYVCVCVMFTGCNRIGRRYDDRRRRRDTIVNSQ